MLPPFLHCLQNVANISGTNVHRLIEEEMPDRNIQATQSKDILLMIKYEDYEEISFLPPDIGVAILVCLRSQLIFVLSLNCTQESREFQ